MIPSIKAGNAGLHTNAESYDATPRAPALETVAVSEVLPPLLHRLQHPCPKVVYAHLLTRGNGVCSMHHLQKSYRDQVTGVCTQQLML